MSPVDLTPVGTPVTFPNVPDSGGGDDNFVPEPKIVPIKTDKTTLYDRKNKETYTCSYCSSPEQTLVTKLENRPRRSGLNRRAGQEASVTRHKNSARRQDSNRWRPRVSVRLGCHSTLRRHR
jgi:hypothetical protein